MARIPIIGPALAAVAYAETEGPSNAALGLAAFDLPSDMIAQIYAGERIIPAADNSAIMAALIGGGGAAAAGVQC